MKIIEPISSALLITGCIYAAGISQNNAFMREFGINPEFSQPPIDKILYDGGLVTFEIFYTHSKLLCVIATVAVLLLLFTWLVAKKRFPNSRLAALANYTRFFEKTYNRFPFGLALLFYIGLLCFSSFHKSQTIGIKLAETFIDRCHWVEIEQQGQQSKACAFRKDKDSIWFYTIDTGDLKIGSKLLSELSEITYFEPTENHH